MSNSWKLDLIETMNGKLDLYFDEEIQRWMTKWGPLTKR